MPVVILKDDCTLQEAVELIGMEFEAELKFLARANGVAEGR